MGERVGGIRDVARESGVSVATVSRVMNGNTNVKPETRDRVLEASKRVDYVPNPAARTLTTKRSKTVAAIIPTIENSVFAKFIAAIEHSMSARDYSLVLAVSNADETLETTAAKKLIAMGAEAFILSGSTHSEILIDLLTRRKIPFVFTSVFDLVSDIPTIGYDNAALAEMAIRYLADKGHSEIAVVHGPLAESDRTEARKTGAMSARHLLNDLRFVETDLSVAGGKLAVKKICAFTPRPTAILCFSDVLALGVYFGLNVAELHIPTDVSVMGFDNLDWSEEITPPLTTIDLPAREMGIAVAEQLMGALEETSGLISKELVGYIIERDSVQVISKQK
jgi:LacI family transcriptional regulator